MSSVALGVKVFKREKKLRNLLQSLDPSFFDTVYVADDGEDSDYKDNLFSDEWSFDLKILDLEYDSGIGTGRRLIVDEMTEDYLMMVDSDHEISQSLQPLLEILEADPDLGGVSTLLLEHGNLMSDCHDLSEISLYDRSDLLVRCRTKNKDIVRKSGHILIPFDFLPNSALFRQECLTDYTWDENYVIEYAHLDFFVGHLKETDWQFGICPEVIIDHAPGGDTDYMKNRHSTTKEGKSRAYFLDKWGYRDVITKTRGWPNNENLIRSGLVPNLFWKLPPRAQHILKNAVNYI
jgi:hypothetical protein